MDQYPHLYTSQPYAFTFGQIVHTVDRVRLRLGPGLAEQVLRLVPANTSCEIMAGVPLCGNELIWWRVDAGGHRGWIAEAAPGGAPLLAPVSLRQQQQVIYQEAERLDLAPSVALAVFAVESAPYDVPGPHLALNFEPHILSDALFERSPGNQAKFYRHFAYGDPPWTAQRWRLDVAEAWRTLGGDQHNERQAIDLACRLFGREIVLRATSMGPGQIMGFNHTMMGYPDACGMFDAWRVDYLAAVRGFFRYIEETELVRPLRQRDWLAFAGGYNGEGNQDRYAAKLIEAIGYVEAGDTIARGFAGRRIFG